MAAHETSKPKIVPGVNATYVIVNPSLLTDVNWISKPYGKFSPKSYLIGAIITVGVDLKGLLNLINV